jgi:murein hydrolase activator
MTQLIPYLIGGILCGIMPVYAEKVAGKFTEKKQDTAQLKIELGDNPKNTLSDVRDDIAKIQPEFERLSEKRTLLEREKVNLSERLVIITEKVRIAEERIQVLEEDIKTSDMREQALTADLSSRKAETAKILAAMGRLSLLPATPLGAVEDEEKTVHTALILRNLTAELKKRADSLVADLKLLRSMRDTLKKNRRELAKEQISLDSDSERLKILMETRQNHIQETNNDLTETQKKLSQLSQKEKTIEGLIEKIDLENTLKAQKNKQLDLAKIQEAKKAAQLLAENNKGTSTEYQQPMITGTVEQQNHNTENVVLPTEQNFISLKGKLVRPILGKIVHQYGMADDTGKKRQGITIQSKSGAIVTAPINSRVIFADNFKRQGSIVILNPVGKYYVVLSGLGVINVSPGQNVAMGEPIGRMASGIGQRNLYVEFRKDKQTTNPNDWLSQTTSNQMTSLR